MTNVFDNVPDYIPVKHNGKLVGKGRMGKDGAVEIEWVEEIDLEQVGGLDVSGFTNTINVIMKNKEKNNGTSR